MVMSHIGAGSKVIAGDMGDVLTQGIVGTVLVLLLALSGYFFKAIKEARQYYQEAANTVRAEGERNEKRLELSFTREAKRNKEYYQEILKTKEETLLSIILEKEKQIEAQKELYNNMAEARTNMIWKPLEEKLSIAHAQVDRLQQIINGLEDKIKLQRDEISNLLQYENKFKEAVKYIDKLIESLEDSSYSIPAIPKALKEDILSSYD